MYISHDLTEPPLPHVSNRARKSRDCAPTRQEPRRLPGNGGVVYAVHAREGRFDTVFTRCVTGMCCDCPCFHGRGAQSWPKREWSVTLLGTFYIFPPLLCLVFIFLFMLHLSCKKFSFSAVVPAHLYLNFSILHIPYSQLTRRDKPGFAVGLYRSYCHAKSRAKHRLCPVKLKTSSTPLHPPLLLRLQTFLTPPSTEEDTTEI